ncbi:hypothetical protein BV25DRAFT_1875757 [Artomyces pyxidatus]|uniref:Uncharacterized protein n=1 Tax=Artomyces pyxidatus TaxID=48021 RepID=A0ACB8TIP6_9AGAM|nr:hypothetical protein BV25DRAFT_1875757 [Artomyces pyxidatus]
MSEPSTGDNAQRNASRHLSATGSFLTTASGVAQSTISVGTYATGLTLSQFPPPPNTIPNSPLTENAASSPAGSTFTLTPNSPSTRFPFPPAPRASPTPGSPASQFPQPRPLPTPQPRPPRDPRPPPSAISNRTFSPYDWHEGSSSISVDPTEERLLSTSFITGLLSSTEAQQSPMSAEHTPPEGQRLLYQTDSGSLLSEMTYPPNPRVQSSLSYRGPGPSRAGPSAYTTVRAGLSDSEPYGDTDTLSSYDTDVQVVQGARGLSRKVSVVGMANATLRNIASGETLPSQRGGTPQTYNSSLPLNPSRPSGWSGMSNELHVPDDLVAHPSSQMHFSPAARSSAGFRPSYTPAGPRERRVSTHSNKTVKSQVSTFISAAGQRSIRAVRQTLEWFRVKPLPPVPTMPNMSYHQEQEYRRMEGAVPLPDLAERADRLGTMLDAGRLPHDSMGSYPNGVNGVEKFTHQADEYPDGARVSGLGGQNWQDQSLAKAKPFGLKTPLTRSQKIKLAAALAVLVFLALVGVIIGIVLGMRHTHPAVTCPGNMTGASCTLNAGCVCTSSSANQCNPLAQSLVNLIPTMNDLFGANYTQASVAAAVFSVLGTPSNNDCSAQARIIDVAPALDIATVPNRTEWAQSALLWSYVQSLNTSSVGALQSFILKANWKSLGGIDGPIPSQSSSFTKTALGFKFDFAGQVVSEPPISFKTDGQPSSSQISQVSQVATGALDRMYTFAAASSSMRQSAMANYWASELHQDPKTFSTFVSLFTSSPILLPFDATETAGGTPLSSLLTNSTSSPFPPPLSCYPTLTNPQLQSINALETTVFGLSSASYQPGFDTSCFPDRPIYGVFDVLRLRLPFPDSRTNVSLQAATLSPGAGSRVVVYNGAALSTLPDSTTPSTASTDPRQYGTLNHLNHVLLNFFTSIPDINVAVAFAQYILSSPAGPPASGSLLSQSLDSIPPIEVAVFGSVLPSDISGVVSSFSTPSGKLFFGTDQSVALRDWTINGAQTGLAWADAANAPTVVHDTTFDNALFNEVWNPAFTFFHTESNAIVNVGNITSGFQTLGLFVP